MIDVLRRNEGGFVRGEAQIEGIEDYRGKNLKVQFQNENLIAIRDEKIIASVPDLICIVNLDSAIPVTTEAIRYGHRVLVLSIPAIQSGGHQRGLKL